MAANGISSLGTKALRQSAKLDLARAKRQGKIVADDGTISGSEDSTKNYFRARNDYDLTELPTYYDDNDVVDNPNTGGLVEGRPWIVPAVVLAGGILMETGDDLLLETGDQILTEV